MADARADNLKIVALSPLSDPSPPPSQPPAAYVYQLVCLPGGGGGGGWIWRIDYYTLLHAFGIPGFSNATRQKFTSAPIVARKCPFPSFLGR